MKNSYLTPTFFAIATLVGACSSGPKSTNLLEQTRSEYQMAQSNPAIAAYAPLEMKQASDALAQANAAAGFNERAETIDKLAYLARQKIALAQEVAKQKSAEAEVVKASRERDQILLDKRTSEVSQAQSNAAQSQQSAQEAQARTAQLEAQLKELAAKQTERGMVITLGNVLFGTDQAHLNAQGNRVAQKLANVLQQNPQRSVLIEGFADSTGSAAHNQQLSERRANAVRTALLDLGIAPERIATRGYGEAYPLAPNNTEQNRQLNRRVEIVLSGEGGKIRER